MESAHLEKKTVCYLKVIHDTKRFANLNVKYDDVSSCDIGHEFVLTAGSVRRKGVWLLSRRSPVFSLIDRTIDFS